MKVLHRLALRAYPRSFREEFGGELQRVFDERLRGCRALRRVPLALFCVADTVLSGLAERRNQRLAHRRRRQHAAGRQSSRVHLSWDAVWRDVRFSLRQFRRTPGFPLLIVASLALGIGANTAIFAVVHSVLLRPLPYGDPDALVAIWSHNRGSNEPTNPVSPANFEAFRAAPSLEGAEAMYSFLTRVELRNGPEPEPVVLSEVTPGMFRLLGRAPVVGRSFEDERDGAVLSHQFWRTRLGADPNVIGRTFTLSAGASTVTVPVVGVMPEDFTFPYGSMLWRTSSVRDLTVDLWLPMSRHRDSRLVDAAGQPNRTVHYLAVVGRLRGGATLERARDELASIAARRALEYPDTNTGWGITVRPLHEQAVGAMRPALIILLCGVGLVLLITCMNVANVLLARAAVRGRDLAVRSALGASRARLVQQMLTESVLLALAGGLAGFGVMALSLRALVAAAPPNLPRLDEVSWSPAVVLFGLAVSLLVGIAVGVIPALSAARSRAQDSLRDGTRTTTSAASRRARSALVVAEIALAMLLTVVGGLLLRSFLAVVNTDPGFNPERLLTMQAAVPPRYAGAEATLRFYDELEARLRALPGVVAVGGTTRLPLGSTNVTTFLEVDGRAVPRAEQPEVEMRRALFDYFGAMQIPVVRGRTFGAEDRAGGSGVTVINEALARRVFPGEDPIGRRVRFSPSGSWLEIVGIVGDIRHGSLEEPPKPEFYVWYRQGPPVGPFVVVRTAGDATALADAVRQVFRDLGADPPRDMQTMEAVKSGSVAARRFVLLLVGTFGVLALTLAALGVFGVVTLIAAERTSEVGIRLALGATPPQVLRLLLGQSFALASVGVGLGALTALIGSRVVQAQLFGVTATDPVTYGAVAALLLATAGVAAYVPARRAMRVDPVASLRAG
ncbi:MAG TPA: ABC transporter permease [Vicinamibacterales bacterium]|nr:ABC transporter permease [Vicinamibacterales bacterium]